MTNEPTTYKLEKAFRLFNIEASVWRRETGNDKVFRDVRLSRSYRDNEGNWQRISSYSQDQLKVVIDQAQQALAYLETLQEA